MQLYPASSNAPEKPNPWSVRAKRYDLTKRGMIMGIINTTPDSFSDGGLFESSEAAIEQALFFLTGEAKEKAKHELIIILFNDF